MLGTDDTVVVLDREEVSDSVRVCSPSLVDFLEDILLLLDKVLALIGGTEA